MKVKLTPTQFEKLQQNFNRSNALREQARVANAQLAHADHSTSDLFETICDAHHIDLSNIDRSSIRLVDGHMILIETSKKSDQIRKKVTQRKKK